MMDHYTTVRDGIRKKIQKVTPDQTFFEMVEKQMFLPRDVSIIHPPLKFTGVYAGLFAQLISACEEFDIPPPILIDFIWKVGVMEAHKHFTDALKEVNEG